MVEQLNHGWFKTERLTFKDNGPIKKKATHTYTVHSRTHEVLGTVKWGGASFNTYVFYPADQAFGKQLLNEIAEFLDYSTLLWRGEKARKRREHKAKLAAKRKRPYRSMIDHEALKARERERQKENGE